VVVALQNCEQDGWSLLQRHLTPDQVEAARKVLDRWRTEFPKLTPHTLLELPNFQGLLEHERKAGLDANLSNLLGLVRIDPLAGLEPMARQVELSRMLGQRALYFAGRVQRLVSAEMELRLLQARGTDEMRQVLANMDQVSASLARFAATGENLQQIVREEREAAVKQVSEELSAQRAGLVEDLARSEEPLVALLEHSQATLDSAAQTSAAISGFLETLDRFLENRASDEPEGEPAPPPPDAPPPRPFDVREYGEAIAQLGTSAEQLGIAATEITELLAQLDQRLPHVQQVLDETAARGSATIDRALAGVLLVGLVLIAAAALSVLLVRRLRPR
jgi:hypothetical protein